MNITGSSSYSAEEKTAIAGWLREELSATQIANLLSAQRRCAVSRNAIIGVIHRDKTLAAIGLHGKVAKGVAAAPSVPRAPKQHLHAGNIRGKKEGRALVPGFAAPKPRPLDDGIAPFVYDATTHHVGIETLKAGECRWPVNDAKPGEKHLFCGRISGLSSYCPHHCRRAGSGYIAAQTREVRSVRSA